MVRTAKEPAKKTTVSKAQAKEPQEAEIAPRTDEIAAPKAEAEEINDFASRADRCPVYPGDLSRLVVAPRRIEHDVSAARSAAALSGLPSDLVGEVAQFTDLLASPVKSLVVLAERNGFYTVPKRDLGEEEDSDGYVEDY